MRHGTKPLGRDWWLQFGLTLGFIGASALLGFIFHVFVGEAVARWRPEYAQMSPLERQWWRNQHNPVTKVNCCTTADGTYAEEDIRDGHYWTKFVYRIAGDSGTEIERTSDWIEVPTDTILDTTPNIHGAPAVWWGVNYPTGGTPTPFIRCFAPGAKGQLPSKPAG